MIFLAKCPLRIGLVGGGTDLENFIQRYGFGKVVNFPTTLNVYITVHKNNRNLYIINYSSLEECSSISNIKNDVARVALEYFDVGPVTVSFLSDIISAGSGLASSTAYMISIIKALSMYTGRHLTEFEICKLAVTLEREYNTHTGYQDAYGCGVGGFKKIHFPRNKPPVFTYFDAGFLRENFDMALFHTRTNRKSTALLKSYNTQSSFCLLEKVEEFEKSIVENNINDFLEIFNKSWEVKKKASNLILGNQELQSWDIVLQKNENILAHKLCGAGGGGYFFTLCRKGSTPKEIKGSQAIKIDINDGGVIGMEL